MKQLIPRKFYYEETHYFSHEFLIKWTAKGLEVQRASVGMPFLPESDVVIVPSYDQFQKFIAKVLALDLSPQDPEPYICDGFEVNCHITFQNTLVKFDIINPEFHNFAEFRNLINGLTVCDEFPDGLFYDDEDEDKEN